MSTINVDAKEISLKVVYYGPGLCGKTTSLEAVHKSIPPGPRPKMVSLATEEDRTLFFDFLPIVASKLGPYTVRLQLYTVPGQVFYNSTRKLVLQGTDGIIFVADSQVAMRDANLESIRNLNENLQEWGASLEEAVHTIQLNKRDLPGIMSVDEMTADLNAFGAPVFETIASTGVGVSDALRETVRMIIKGISSRGFSRKTDVARGKPPPPPTAVAKASGSVRGKAVKWDPTPTPTGIDQALAEQVQSEPALPDEGLGFSSCWSDAAQRSEAWAVEQMIRSGLCADAIIKCDQLVGLAATSAGYSGDNRPLFCLLCGISGDQYRRFRALVIKALRGDPVTQHDALFAVHFATHFAFAV